MSTQLTLLTGQSSVALTARSDPGHAPGFSADGWRGSTMNREKSSTETSRSAMKIGRVSVTRLGGPATSRPPIVNDPGSIRIRVIPCALTNQFRPPVAVSPIGDGGRLAFHRRRAQPAAEWTAPSGSSR